MGFAAIALLVAAAADPRGAPMPPPTPPDGPPPVVRAAPAAEDAPRPKLLGAQLTAGAPQGFALSATVRPLAWLRLHAGFAHDTLGPGVQGGVTLVPWQRTVSPAVTVDAGHFFAGDATGWFSGTFPDAFDPALRKLGYDFVATQLGVEIGSQQGLLFFVRGGLAWLRSGLDAVSGYRPPGSSATVDVSPVRLRATTPTVNLGLALAIW